MRLRVLKVLSRLRPLAGVLVALVPLLLTIGAVPRSILGDLLGGSEQASCCVVGACCCSMLGSACACEPGTVPGVDRVATRDAFAAGGGDAGVGRGEDGGANLAALRCSQTVQMIVSLGLAGLPPARPTGVDLAVRSERADVFPLPGVERRSVEIPTPPPRG